MYKLRYPVLLFLFVFAFAYAGVSVFPRAHPRNLHEAQAQGLHRLSADELKAFIPGTMEAVGIRHGKGKIRIYHPDGSFEAQGFQMRKGTWRIDSKDSTWCRTVEKKMRDQENCFAVFRAPDGIHFFDYDVADSFYAGTWRPQKK